MKETDFQSNVIDKIEAMFPGCEVMKQDATYKQGFPDIVVFYKKKWAMLEFKKSKDASHQPNQDYYVDKTNRMSFARFIYPENEQEVLNELESTLRPRRRSCVPRS